MPKVKGVAFRSVMESVEELGGAAARERTLEHLPTELRKLYEYRSLLPGNWYPIEDYAALWLAVHKGMGSHADTPHKVGRCCVRRDVGGVHKFIIGFLSRETVVALSARLFRLYYDTGVARTELVGQRVARVTFEGCKGFTALMWAEVVGSTEMFTEVGSKLSARAFLESGGGDGDERAVIAVSWG